MAKKKSNNPYSNISDEYYQKHSVAMANFKTGAQQKSEWDTAHPNVDYSNLPSRRDQAPHLKNVSDDYYNRNRDAMLNLRTGAEQQAEWNKQIEEQRKKFEEQQKQENKWASDRFGNTTNALGNLLQNEEPEERTGSFFDAPISNREFNARMNPNDLTLNEPADSAKLDSSDSSFIDKAIWMLTNIAGLRGSELVDKMSGGQQHINQSLGVGREMRGMRPNLIDVANLINSTSDHAGEDTFGQRFLANLNAGYNAQRENEAWNDYMNAPSDYTRDAAVRASDTARAFNEKDADLVGKGGLISNDLASYLPQFMDQVRYEAAPAIIGTAIGGADGYKVGRLLGSAGYSYQSMRGAAFKSLISNGVDEKTALNAASNESVISTVVEMFDELVNMGLGVVPGVSTAKAGIGAIKDQIMAQAWGKFGKFAAQAGVEGIGYLTNIGSEGLEEYIQECVSIANERSNGTDNIADLLGDALDIAFNGLKDLSNKAQGNEISEDSQRLFEAFGGGARLALMLHPAGRASNVATEVMRNNATGRQIKSSGKAADIFQVAKEAVQNADIMEEAAQTNLEKLQAADQKKQAEAFMSKAMVAAEDGKQLSAYEIGKQANQNDVNARNTVVPHVVNQMKEEAKAVDTINVALNDAAENGGVTTDEAVLSILDDDKAVEIIEKETGKDFSKLSLKEQTQAVENYIADSTREYVNGKTIGMKSETMGSIGSRILNENFERSGIKNANEYIKTMDAYYSYGAQLAGNNTVSRAEVASGDVLNSAMESVGMDINSDAAHRAIIAGYDDVTNGSIELKGGQNGTEKTGGSGSGRIYNVVASGQTESAPGERSKAAEGYSSGKQRRAAVTSEVNDQIRTRNGQRVSAFELGTSNGTDSKRNVVLDDKAIEKLGFADGKRELERRTGAEVILVSGVLEQEVETKDGKRVKSYVRGVYDADNNRLICQADNINLDFYKIGLHEEFHGKLKGLKGAERERFINEIKSKLVGLDDAEFDELLQAYDDKYGWSNMGYSEADIVEEIFADAYAGIDVWDYLTPMLGATRYTDAVRKYAEAIVPSEMYGDDGFAKYSTADEFEMAAPLEETDRLIAIHNMHESALQSMIDLGGLAMPSFAVKPAHIGHTTYGVISVIAGKDSIDPTMDRDAVIYGGDAWTPTFPEVHIKPSNKALKAISKRMDKVFADEKLYKYGGLGTNTYHIALDEDNARDAFERWGSFEDAYGRNNMMKLMFLKETGRGVPITQMEKAYKNGYDRSVFEKVNALIDVEKRYDYSVNELKDEYGKEINNILREFYLEKYGDKKFGLRLADQMAPEGGEAGFNDIMDLLDITARYNYDRSVGNNTQLDTSTVDESIRKAFEVDGVQEEYDSWLKELGKGTIEKKGIRNDKDMFTPSGNRRTFEQLHYDFTLDNIVKAMRSEAKQGRVQFMSGPGSVKGAALKSYKNIEEVRAERDRILDTLGEEGNSAYDEFHDATLEIAKKINSNDWLSGADDLADILGHAKTASRILNYMRKEFSYLHPTMDLAEDIENLGKMANSLPMEYFEAKLYRAFPVSEALAYVVPDNLDENLKKNLKAAGGNVIEYKAEDMDDRLKKINGIEGARFSTEETLANSAVLGLGLDEEGYGKYQYSERGEKYVEQVRNGGVLWDEKKNPQRGSSQTGREYAESIRRDLRQRASGTSENRTDSEGRLIGEADARKLKGSVVKTEDGKYIAVYHLTDSVYDKHLYGDVGFHYGSFSQAEQRGIAKGIDSPVYRRGYLSIRNPIVITEDAGFWLPIATAQYLSEYGYITDEEKEYIVSIAKPEQKHLKTESAFKELYDFDSSRELRRILKSKGYDGIIYSNGYEGGDFSYIVFDDSQVILTDNGYLDDQINKYDGTSQRSSTEDSDVREIHRANGNDIRATFNALNNDAAVGKLAERVFDSFEFLQEFKDDRKYPISFVSNERYEKLHTTPGSYGQFTGNAGYGNEYGILINADKLNELSDQEKASTILHEVIHACTVSYIGAANRYLSDARRLGKAYDYAVDVIPEDASDAVKAAASLIDVYSNIKADKRVMKLYGLTDEMEMVAELSNPEFRSYLKKKSLWSRIVDGIKRILGIQSNALDATTKALERILESVDESNRRFVNIENRTRFSQEDSDGNALTAEQQKYFKDSKIRDDDGKLRVMYHGTENAGFTIFNSEYGTSAKAMFFTTSRDVAKTYSGTKDEYTPTNFKTAKQVQDAIQAEMGGDEEYTVKKEDGMYVLYDDGEFADSFEDLNDVFNGWLDYSGYGGSSANYKTYLNVTNPYIVDGKGTNWDSLPEIDGNNTTNGYVEYAKKNGYDGVIFKNITDIGLYSSSSEKQTVSDVVAVFDSNQIKSVTNQAPTSDPDIRYSQETDPETLEFLNNQELVPVYRAMQLIDGKLYPPMAAIVNGSLVEAAEPGVWYTADEHPELIKLNDKGKPQFNLNKGNGKGLDAAYNPYWHTSSTPLNDQFTSAYDRPNLVVVKGYVPKSELTSGYRAQYAKDPVGIAKWHAGTVDGKLRKIGKGRQVILSRYFMLDDNPVVSEKDAAAFIREQIGDSGITVPWNVVTPALRKALEAEGVAVDKTPSGRTARTYDQQIEYENSQRYSTESMSDAELSIRDENDYLKGAYASLLTEVRTDKRSASRMRTNANKTADRIREEYESRIDKTDLRDRMNHLVQDYIIGGEQNEGLAYQNAKNEAVDIARDIVNNAGRMKNADEYDRYLDLKKRVKNNDGIYLDPSLRGDPEKYQEIRKRLFGKVNLKNSGTPLDSFYQGLVSDFGELFDPDVAPGIDQLQTIEEVLNTLAPIYENPYNGRIAEAIELCANDILMSLTDGTIVPDGSSQNARQQARVEKARQNGIDYARKAIAAERVYEKKRIDNALSYYRNREKNRLESAERERLRKIANRLNNRKLPKATRDLLEQYIGELDLISVKLTNKRLDNLKDLRLWYEDQQTNNPDFVKDPEIEKLLQRLSTRQISELDIEEVRWLTTCLQNIENELAIAKKTIDTEDQRDIHIQAEESMADIDHSKGNGNNAFTQGIDSFFVNGTLSPVRAMKRIVGYRTDSPIYQRTLELEQGQIKSFDWQRRAEANFLRWTNDSKFMESIVGKKAMMLDIGNGIQITPAMRMSLYLHSKNEQNMRHIIYGGITVPNMKAYKSGNMSKAYGKGSQTVKLNAKQVRDIIAGMTDQEKTFADAAAKYFNGMSQESINEVSEKLKGYSLALVQNYFPINTNTNFTLADYETVKMDGTIEGMGFLKERQNASNPIYLRDITDVLNKSISSTAKYVGLAIPVRNFNKIYNVSSSEFGDEAKAALEEMKNAKNLKDRYAAREKMRNARELFTGSMRESVMQNWDVEGIQYIEKMMGDIQNPKGSRSAWAKMFQNVRGNYAGSTLGLSASVAMKQAASYPTAAAVLGWKPLNQAFLDVTKIGRKFDMDLVNKYTPLLWHRASNFNVQYLGNVGTSVNQNRLQKLLSSKALNWITDMDVATTRLLWFASEHYVQNENKALVKGSDAYYKAVAEVYNRVITETQPNYTTMERPELLRTDDTLLASMMMFKTQSFQNFNVLYDAIGNYSAKKDAVKLMNSDENKAALTSAKKDLSRAVSSQVVQTFVFAAMTAVCAALLGRKDKYKDDEGEVTMESLGKQVGKDMISSAMSMVPFGGEIYNVLARVFLGEKYYGFDNITASSLDDLFNAFIKAADSVKSGVDAIANGGELDWNEQRINLDSVMNAVTRTFGIPYDNASKIFEAVVQHVAKGRMGEYEGTYTYLRLTKKMSDTGAYYDNLFKAYENDKKSYESLKKKMIADGFDEEKMRNAINSRLKDRAGVNSVSDLDHKLVDPKIQSDYDVAIGLLLKSPEYKKLSDDEQGKRRSAVESTLKDPEKMQKLDDAGLDVGTYALYLTARKLADIQGDNNGSYNKDEKAAAVKMLLESNEISSSEASALKKYDK